MTGRWKNITGGTCYVKKNMLCKNQKLTKDTTSPSLVDMVKTNSGTIFFPRLPFPI